MARGLYKFASGLCWATGALLCGIIGCIVYYTAIRTPTAAETYERNINGVVELRARNEDGSQGFGTAEITDTDGTLITNAHVVTYSRLGQLTEFDGYSVRFAFEEEYRAVVLVGYDAEIDLAVLRFTEKPEFITPVKLGSGGVRAGDTVYAMGNAVNYGISITRGTVSIPLIEIEYSEQTRRVIQCDLTIAEGNSGGALLNERGELIGITTFRIKDSSGSVIYGLAYCIPIDTVTEFLNRTV